MHHLRKRLHKIHSLRKDDLESQPTTEGSLTGFEPATFRSTF